MRVAIFLCCVGGMFFGSGRVHAQDRDFTNSLKMKFSLIPAGEFQMGVEGDLTDTLNAFHYVSRIEIEDEAAQHKVRITAPFYMGVCEVRLREFLMFYHAAKYRLEAERDGKPSWGRNASGVLVESTTYRPWNTGWEMTQEHPAVYVSWNDAVAFCEWLSQKEGRKYRLPTEAEWEYACRAGASTRYWCGDDPETLTRYANVADQDLKQKFPNSVFAQASEFPKVAGEIPFPYINRRDGYVYSAPVGRFAPNPFGLHDMHGNVWEWCSDWYGEHYYDQSPGNDPQGPATGTQRVIRGGGWHSVPSEVRCASRSSDQPDGRDYLVGFRVVCEPAATTARITMQGKPQRSANP